MVASYLFLYESNSDMLFMVQLRSLFNSGTLFFEHCMQRPGGLLQWAGLWFTQLFYEPWLGVSALTALWLITFVLLKTGFKIPNALSPLLAIPFICLIASIVELGYWIYFLRQPGYCFRESLGILSVALILNLPSSLPKLKGSYLGIAVAILSYPLIGFYSCVASASILVKDLCHRRYISAIVCLALGIIAPFLWKMSYATMRPDEVFTVGYPFFLATICENFEKTLPILYAVIFIALLPVIALLEKPLRDLKATPAIAVALFLATGAGGYAYIKGKNYTNENFHAECVAYRAADECNWEGVLDVMDNLRGEPTRELVILKNLALLNTGSLGNQMYQYKDRGRTPMPDDTLRVNLAETAAPLIYLHHGMANFAQRWCIETSVELEPCVASVKVLTLSALINKEYKVAEKYLTTLSRTMYYKDWAERWRKMIHESPQKIAKTPELRKAYELNHATENYLQSDQGLCEKYLHGKFNILPMTDSPVLREVCMAYAMTSKDIQRFWMHFNIYASHLDGDMPIHYQEAAYLYGILEPQTRDTSGMPFDKERIVNRYARFDQTTKQLVQMRMSEEAIGEATRTEFGDTFWWSYYFDRGAVYY